MTVSQLTIHEHKKHKKSASYLRKYFINSFSYVIISSILSKKLLGEAIMTYRFGDRKQNMLLPDSIEEYVPIDAPVRAYDAFVDALDFNELAIITSSNQVGNPPYDPRAMLKLMVYGYSYGVHSSRKLERACS